MGPPRGTPPVLCRGAGGEDAILHVQHRHPRTGASVSRVSRLEDSGVGCRTRARSGRRALRLCLVLPSASTLLRPRASLPFAAEAPPVLRLTMRSKRTLLLAIS